MARETKAQREAREEAAMQKQYEEERDNYFPRLMNALVLANTVNYRVVAISTKEFRVYPEDNYDAYRNISVEYNPEDQRMLEDMEDDIRYKVEEREAAEAFYRARQAALNKLTREERELLGL